MKQECIKHTCGAYETRISLKIKLLHFSLRITRLRYRSLFKTQNIFAEAFNSMSKEYSPRPSGDNLLRQLYTNDWPQYEIPALRSLDLPLKAVNDIARRERRRNMHTKLQSKA
jgi:hypothetical protein